MPPGFGKAREGMEPAIWGPKGRLSRLGENPDSIQTSLSQDPYVKSRGLDN